MRRKAVRWARMGSCVASYGSTLHACKYSNPRTPTYPHTHTHNQHHPGGPPQTQLAVRREARLTRSLMGADGAVEISVLPPGGGAECGFQLTDLKARGRDGVV